LLLLKLRPLYFLMTLSLLFKSVAFWHFHNILNNFLFRIRCLLLHGTRVGSAFEVMAEMESSEGNIRILSCLTASAQGLVN
jgi:hypothetical protein